MLYTFDTATTMKPYNNKKWYICDDIVRRKTIVAKNLSEALKKYQDAVMNKGRGYQRMPEVQKIRGIWSSI